MMIIYKNNFININDNIIFNNNLKNSFLKFIIDNNNSENDFLEVLLNMIKSPLTNDYINEIEILNDFNKNYSETNKNAIDVIYNNDETDFLKFFIKNNINNNDFLKSLLLMIKRNQQSEDNIIDNDNINIKVLNEEKNKLKLITEINENKEIINNIINDEINFLNDFLNINFLKNINNINNNEYNIRIDDSFIDSINKKELLNSIEKSNLI